MNAEVQRAKRRTAEDIDEQEWLRFAASNPAFDFLKEPREDIYTLDDGKPFHDQGSTTAPGEAIVVP